LEFEDLVSPAIHSRGGIEIILYPSCAGPDQNIVGKGGFGVLVPICILIQTKPTKFVSTGNRFPKAVIWFAGRSVFRFVMGTTPKRSLCKRSRARRVKRNPCSGAPATLLETVPWALSQPLRPIVVVSDPSRSAQQNIISEGSDRHLYSGRAQSRRTSLPASRVAKI